MTNLLQFFIIASTLGLPLWFAYLDRRASPRLRWIQDGGSIPTWGHAVVIVGVGIAILIALAAPLSELPPAH